MNEQPGTNEAGDWRGRTLTDSQGERIGEIAEIYLSQKTHEPEWALVDTGTESSFVPLAGASRSGAEVRVRATLDQVRAAPAVAPGTRLSEEEVSRLNRHYAVDDRTAGLQSSSRGYAQPMEQPNTNDQSVSDLVKQLSTQTSALVRQELKLAQLEMTEKGKRAGIGAGLFGGAGLVAAYGVGALIAAIILLLATFLEAWIGALIVTVVLFAVAGVLALTGKKQVEQATPPAPEEAIESTKRDVDEVKGRASRS